MNNQAFHAAYHEGRNGANHFVRHWAARQLQYSDGVEQCAEAGCHWLLDIIATECLKPLRAAGEYMSGDVTITAAGGTADIKLEVNEEVVWSRHIDYTDMVEGTWTFYLVDEGERFALILPSEY